MTGCNLSQHLAMMLNFGLMRTYIPKYDWTASGEAGETSKYQSSDKSFTYLWDNYFTFNKDFGKHHLDAMVGSSAQWNKYNYMNGNVSGFFI